MSYPTPESAFRVNVVASPALNTSTSAVQRERLAGRAGLSGRFRFLLPAFDAGGAPLYAHLAYRAAIELEWATTPLRLALAPFEGERPERLLPLRLLALIHREVLAGQLPGLRPYYRSVGGTVTAEPAWSCFREAVLQLAPRLPSLLADPLRHNDVAYSALLQRCLGLIVGETKLPVRLLQVGAQAGLLLQWDRHLRRRELREDVGSPAGLDTDVRERHGCDVRPIDLSSASQVLDLRSAVWPDLVDDLILLDDAIATVRRAPVLVDRAEPAPWLRQHAGPRSSVTTVVFRSLPPSSTPPGCMAAIDETVRHAARSATAVAPLAYLRFELVERCAAGDGPPGVTASLSIWPGGRSRVIATADLTGRRVRWLT